jgi:GT2 family glycosyltransferase
VSAVVIFPWRPGDTHRERAFDYVRRWVHGSGVPTVSVDHERSATFSRAASKNLGARQANWADVLIFNDADMILPLDSYGEIAKVARDSHRMVIGYVEYCPFDAAISDQIYRGVYPDPFDAPSLVGTVQWSVGGIVAIRRDAFYDVGGYDERFRGWGCEDFAFAIACATVLGPNERLDGRAMHFFHEHATLYDNDDNQRFNAELLGRYNLLTSIEDLRALQDLP